MPRVPSFGCLVVAATMSAACGIDQKRFEPLYRAGKAISGATEVGATLVEYRELMQSLATEIEVAEDRASSSDELQLVAFYKDALAAYRDAATMWQAKIELASAFRDKPPRIMLGPRSGPSEAFFGPLVDKYDLRLSVDASNTIAVDEMQQEMWRIASEHIAAAEAIYNK